MSEPLIAKIVKLWQRKSMKIDWELHIELLVEALRSSYLDDDKVRLCKEIVDATTRRGYFKGEYRS
jgi:hypothetical protein